MSLLVSLTRAHGPVEGCLRWRCDKDINHDNFQSALKQLSKNLVMPTSNTRDKWEVGAEVEAEGASGKWWWAKISACFEDGTYDVAIFDDHPEGGQIWYNVRPVHLRSRVQGVRPTGIARRPGTDIPLWDGDDGSAFLDAMEAEKKRLGRWVDGESEDSDDSDLMDDLDYEFGSAHSGLSGDGAGAANAADKGTSRRRRRKKNKKGKSGQARKKSSRRKRISKRLWRAVSKSKLNAQSKNEENSSKQLQTDADAKMSKGRKDSNSTGRNQNGPAKGAASNGQPQNTSLTKLKKISPNRSRSDNSLLNKSKHSQNVKKIVCKVPLVSYVGQDSSNDRVETKEHTSSDHDAETKCSDGLPSAAGRTRLGRQISASDLENQSQYVLNSNNEDGSE